MDNRKVAGIISLLFFGGAIFTYTILPVWNSIVILISQGLPLYLLFSTDTRVKPYTTFFDWLLGTFKSPEDMGKHTLKNRFNMIEYKSEKGPFKIRLIFNRRFKKEEINTAKQELQQQLQKTTTQN